MTTMWWTGDLHFGHKFLSELRGFGREAVDAHDQFLIDNWNGVVGAKDEVHVLGDFSFWGTKTGRSLEIFKALHGVKHLVVGNHDHSTTLALPWASVTQIGSHRIGGQRVVTCHFPMVAWNHAHHGAWHLHGHTHGNLVEPFATGSTRMDVGIDCHPESRPFHWDEIVGIMSTRTYDYVDHHTAESAARELGTSSEAAVDSV